MSNESIDIADFEDIDECNNLIHQYDLKGSK